jgi:hypothetical protein
VGGGGGGGVLGLISMFRLSRQLVLY